MRNLTLKHKNKLLYLIIILADLHAFFRGSKVRVDWYFLIEHDRRIDYAVMYLSKHIIYIIYAYCLLFPKGIKRDTKILIFILSIFDIFHYFALSHIGLEWFKLMLVLLSFYIYKKKFDK